MPLGPGEWTRPSLVLSHFHASFTSIQDMEIEALMPTDLGNAVTVPRARGSRLQWPIVGGGKEIRAGITLLHLWEVS